MKASWKREDENNNSDSPQPTKLCMRFIQPIIYHVADITTWEAFVNYDPFLIVMLMTEHITVVQFYHLISENSQHGEWYKFIYELIQIHDLLVS